MTAGDLTPGHLIWFLLVQAAEFFQTFMADGISATSIGCARDAFAHTVLKLKEEEITGRLNADKDGPIYLCLIHDEASLRVRSYIRSG